MVFNSLTFLVFFAWVLLVHRLPLPWRLRKGHLLLASYVFYAAWNPPFVVLLWLSTVVDWFVARALGVPRPPSARRGLLAVSLATNLGLLAVFKYGDFLLQSTASVLAAAGIAWSPAPLDIVLPMGISFYTFQTLSYTLDVYRGDARPADSFLDYALYVTFFPQLVAGPIVRSRSFLPQCTEPPPLRAGTTAWGLSLLVLGLFEKVVLADHHLAPVADALFAGGAEAGFVSAWSGTLAFSAQIFFDFAGYSTCAIGAALCLGFRLPDNFRFPYAAVGFSDFWRRWHVSLSTWLRDYLYIPMGGNRRGAARTRLHLMATMLLGGLWHGAAWRFVVWGGLHGLYLGAERLVREWAGRRELRLGPGGRLATALLTYALVCYAWVFFRAPDIGEAVSIASAMVGAGAGGQPVDGSDTRLVLGLTGALLAGQWWLRDRTLEDVAARMAWWLRGLVLAMLVLAILHTRGETRAFIYFQF